MDDVMRRGNAVGPLVESWRSLDEQRRRFQGELDGLRQLSRSDTRLKTIVDKKSPEFAFARDELKALSTKIKEGEAKLDQLERDVEDLLLSIPNAPHASVPVGDDESANVVLHSWGDKPAFAFEPKAHWDVGEALGILDFVGGDVRALAGDIDDPAGLRIRIDSSFLKDFSELHVLSHRLRFIVPTPEHYHHTRIESTTICKYF